jgi:LPXTG-motif cell wall-anchored protein
VTITITNGVAASYTIDGGEAVMLSADERSVRIPDLPAGEYTVTEEPPENGTTISKIDGRVTGSYTTTVTVTEGDTTAANAAVTFTNDLSKLTFSKEWQGGDSSQPLTTWPEGGEMTVTIHRKSANGTPDESFALTYTVTKGQMADGTEIGTDGPKLIVKDASTFTFEVSGLPYAGAIDGTVGKYVYYVTEDTVPGYQPPTYQSENGATLADGAPSGGKIVNKPESGYELPHTGGIGTTWFTLSGAILAAGALVLYGCGLRRRRKGGR